MATLYSQCDFQTKNCSCFIHASFLDFREGKILHDSFRTIRPQLDEAGNFMGVQSVCLSVEAARRLKEGLSGWNGIYN